MWREIAVVLSLLLVLTSISSKPLISYYSYDRSVKLNPEIIFFKEGANYKAYKVYYDSINGVRVPALLMLPKKGNPPYPCVVFLHGYGGCKEDALNIAEIAGAEGYAVFSIDAVYHGERKVPGKEMYSPNVTESISAVIQTVVDLRRGVDFLKTLSYIDGSRIGYLGGSMGGILGSIFIGVEHRIKAAVIIVGGGNMTLMIMTSIHPSVVKIREYMKQHNLTIDELKDVLQIIDPLNFINNTNIPIQFHLGRHDKIVPYEAGLQLYEKANQPKFLYVYDSGHDVPLDIVAIRVLDFFDKYLKEETWLISREQFRIIISMLIVLIMCSAIVAMVFYTYRLTKSGRAL